MSAPAGWHLQPDGRERFWDGSQWTEQFRMPAPSDPTAPPPPSWAQSGDTGGSGDSGGSGPAADTDDEAGSGDPTADGSWSTRKSTCSSR